MNELPEIWRTTVADLSPARVAEIEQAGSDLLRRWSEPHRTYHDVSHLRAVLEHIETLRAEASDARVCSLAAWFHDAVYEGRPGTDEADSAALAAEVLGRLGADAGCVAEVVRLVELTATHAPAAGDANGAVLCDADLAILGSEPGDYAAYASAVRAEYSHVPEPDFRAGRAAVLRRLLDRNPLFVTTTARARWETAARRNLTTELTALTSA